MTAQHRDVNLTVITEILTPDYCEQMCDVKLCLYSDPTGFSPDLRIGAMALSTLDGCFRSPCVGPLAGRLWLRLSAAWFAHTWFDHCDVCATCLTSL